METAKKSLGQITFVSAADSLPLVNGDYLVVTERTWTRHDGKAGEVYESTWLASWDDECGWSAAHEDNGLPGTVVRLALIRAY